jgi:hypothetical protein
VSSQVSGGTAELGAVTGPVEGDGGVTHGARLLAFTNAVMAHDEPAIARERNALRAVLSEEAFVDACAVIAAFNVVDRIADATGIPLDPMMAAMSADVRAELDLTHFRSAANTPGVISAT